MTAAYLITFREGLEAALIIGILLSCLRALKMNRQQIYVWVGVLAGVVLSVLFAWMFSSVMGGFEGTVEKLYEGILMLGAAGLITHLVFWMRTRGKDIHKNLTRKVTQSVVQGTLWTVGVVAMMSVVREGVEMIIFFQALVAQAQGSVPLISGGLGILSAVMLALIIFWTTKNVPVKAFFTYTAYVLVLIAAGLLAHGVVELQGAGWLPTFLKPVYDLSTLLPEKEGVGSLLKAGLGYDANPSLLAVMGYLFYLLTMGALLFRKFK